jgi:hypothetical protein
MSVKVNAASARIAPAFGEARPGVHVGPERVTLHLTKGFIPDSPQGLMSHALRAIGTVDIAMGPKDNLSGWEFGFIQIARARDVSFYYAGKARSQGGIVVHAHVPPALPEALILDTDVDIDPWTRHRPRYTYLSPTIRCETGDHPAVRAGRELQNRRTSAANYLYHVVTDVEFWTVFSAMDDVGHFSHLRHLYWHLRYDVMFSWAAAQPVVKRMASRLTVGEDAAGEPQDPAVRGLLANPAMPFSFNSRLHVAIRNAITTGPEQNRSDLAERFATVPGDFWTE